MNQGNETRHNDYLKSGSESLQLSENLSKLIDDSLIEITDRSLSDLPAGGSGRSIVIEPPPTTDTSQTLSSRFKHQGFLTSSQTLNPGESDQSISLAPERVTDVRAFQQPVTTELPQSTFSSLLHDHTYCDNELSQDWNSPVVSSSKDCNQNSRSRELDEFRQSDSDEDIDLGDPYEENSTESGQKSKVRERFHLDSPSKRKSLFKNYRSSKFNLFGRLFSHLRSYGIFSYQNTSSGTQPYVALHRGLEDSDPLTGPSTYSYKNLTKRRTRATNLEDRTFRGSYRYSRADLNMAIFRKLLYFLFQRSTLALVGAFLIHVTLGTVYTLSNVNSYLTSYMRKHNFPEATYAWSVWLSSTYVIGQGFSMVLGGYLEKKFSAQLASCLGCALHSLSIISTSRSINYGPLAVLLTYGFLPGFGCGLAYMTPLSNGFGWFPNRKGLVAGVILAGFGIGTFVFNVAQTAYVNPNNLSPPEDANGYFTQESILEKVPSLFIFMGTIYAIMQVVGCSLLFKPPLSNQVEKPIVDRMALLEPDSSLSQSIRTREFVVLFVVYGLTTQGVLFVNSMLKEYGQLFIGDDLFLAWTGSMASIANSAGRLSWGIGVDRYSFTQCFTAITTIFGSILFIMPFEFVLSSKTLYLLGTLGLFGSFSGWMSTYPVHLARVFGRTNSGMIYGFIYISQSICGVFSAILNHYLIDNYSRFVPFFCMAFLQALGLLIYHVFYPK